MLAAAILSPTSRDYTTPTPTELKSNRVYISMVVLGMNLKYLRGVQPLRHLPLATSINFLTFEGNFHHICEDDGIFFLGI